VKGGKNKTAKHGGDLGAVPDVIRSLDDVLFLLDYIRGEIISLENSVVRSRALIALAGEYHSVIQASELEVRINELERKVFGVR